MEKINDISRSEKFRLMIELQEEFERMSWKAAKIPQRKLTTTEESVAVAIKKHGGVGFFDDYILGIVPPSKVFGHVVTARALPNRFAEIYLLPMSCETWESPYYRLVQIRAELKSFWKAIAPAEEIFASRYIVREAINKYDGVGFFDVLRPAEDGGKYINTGRKIFGRVGGDNYNLPEEVTVTDTWITPLE
jgi:hypothetical protein